MSQKKYKATLKGHSEEWTQEEHDAVQKMTGDRFGEYKVEVLQPQKPADVPSAKAATKNADTPAA